MANPNMANMRSLPLPKGFDGTRPEEWKDFVLKLKSFLNIQEHDFGEIMDFTAIDRHVIADVRFVTRDADNTQICSSCQDVKVLEVSFDTVMQWGTTYHHPFY